MIWHCPSCGATRETGDSVREILCLDCCVWCYPATPAVAARVAEHFDATVTWPGVTDEPRVDVELIDREGYDVSFVATVEGLLPPPIIVEDLTSLEMRTPRDERN